MLKKLEGVFENLGLNINSFDSMSVEEIQKEIKVSCEYEILDTILQDINSENLDLKGVNNYLIELGNEDIKREFEYLQG